MRAYIHSGRFHISYQHHVSRSKNADMCVLLLVSLIILCISTFYFLFTHQKRYEKNLVYLMILLMYLYCLYCFASVYRVAGEPKVTPVVKNLWEPIFSITTSQVENLRLAIDGRPWNYFYNGHSSIIMQRFCFCLCNSTSFAKCEI